MKLKYILSTNHTLAKKVSKSTGIAGSYDKRCITGTFTVSLKGGFLPSISYMVGTQINVFHAWIILLKRESETLQQYPWIYKGHWGSYNSLPQCSAWNFKQPQSSGLITDDVTSHLLQSNVYFGTAPNNMTHLFQPLDLTVNGHCKKISLIMHRLITHYRLEQNWKTSTSSSVYH